MLVRPLRRNTLSSSLELGKQYVHAERLYLPVCPPVLQPRNLIAVSWLWVTPALQVISVSALLVTYYVLCVSEGRFLDREAGHSHPSNAKVKATRSFTSVSSIRIHRVWCLTTDTHWYFPLSALNAVDFMQQNCPRTELELNK